MNILSNSIVFGNIGNYKGNGLFYTVNIWTPMHNKSIKQWVIQHSICIICNKIKYPAYRKITFHLAL